MLLLARTPSPAALPVGVREAFDALQVRAVPVVVVPPGEEPWFWWSPCVRDRSGPLVVVDPAQPRPSRFGGLALRPGPGAAAKIAAAVTARRSSDLVFVPGEALDNALNAGGTASGGLELGPPVALDGSDAAAMIAAESADREGILACASLRRDGGSGGALSVKIALSGSGVVTRASLDRSSLCAPEVEDCVVARFAHMQFPAPAWGRTVVTFPVAFP